MVAACEGLRVAIFFARRFHHTFAFDISICCNETIRSPLAFGILANPYRQLKASGNSPDLTSYNTVRCSMTGQFKRDIGCVVGVVGLVQGL